MIHLKKDYLVNCGQVRACYMHPHNAHRIIKVPIGKTRKHTQANISEIKGYHSLMIKHTDLTCISHCYGFVNTNLGRGLECDCIRNDSGIISKTLWEIVIYQDDCDVDYVVNIIENFLDDLIFRKIFIFDLNLKNIALKVLGDGSYKPVLIDLKGANDNHEFLPISSYFSYFSTKKLTRRSAQLLERISLFREKRLEYHSADI